jgi:hypothetical protein
MQKLCLTALVASSVIVAVPANAATSISKGTVDSLYLSAPTVRVDTDRATYSMTKIGTYQINATDDFMSANGSPAGRIGAMNGSVEFSRTINAVLAQTLTDLFVFSDGDDGSYNFSGTSVQTLTFDDKPGVATSGSFNVFGSLLNTSRGVSATAATLRIAFSSTGGAPYSSSGTLSIGGMAAAVPEPATWAMLLVGFGMVGAAARYRRRSVKVSLA